MELLVVRQLLSVCQRLQRAAQLKSWLVKPGDACTPVRSPEPSSEALLAQVRH